MGPKLKDGIEEIDEDLFEDLPPPEETFGPKEGGQTVLLPSLKDMCQRGTPIIPACLSGFSLLTLSSRLPFHPFFFAWDSVLFRNVAGTYRASMLWEGTLG